MPSEPGRSNHLQQRLVMRARSQPGCWAALFALAFWIAGFLGAASPSERFHCALPISFVFSALLCGKWTLAQARRFALPLLAILAVEAALFWLLVSHQARDVEGRALPGEVGWKMLHVASILVLYGLWSRAWTRFAAVPWRRKSSARPAPQWALWAARGAAIATFAPFVFTNFNVHRTKVSNATDPRRAERLKFETAWFFSGDGVRLHGWWIPAARPTRRSVVVCHGVGANSGNFLGVAPFLHRAGFNVLFFDFRGHGDSGGHTTSFGLHEALDVHAACKYLGQSRGQNRIALYGFSMGGGAISLAFAPRFHSDALFNTRVRAVILDSTFAAFEPLVENEVALLPPWARPLSMRALDVCSRLEIGATPRDILPQSVIARVSPRPLLLIHGDADQLIDVSQARRMLQSAREPRQLRIVRGAGHCLCRLIDPAPYEKSVAHWLRDALK